MPTDPSLLPPPDDEQKGALKETHASFWVTASAGSGKTMLLTQRFLALLLDGASPERILCLTYTRAAAAEMATRILDALKSCTDTQEIIRLYRAFFDRDPSDEERTRALTLHTRSLDCKGGLRVMTFHAFCQSVLGKFPLESGVAPHFRLVEQGRKQQLGRDALLATTTNPQQLAIVNNFMALETCATCISDIAARARSPKELARAKAVVARLFACLPKKPTPPLAREVLERLKQTLEQHRSTLKITDSKKLQKLSAWLKSAKESGGESDYESGSEEEYRSLFLTKNGLLPKNSFLTKGTLDLLSCGTARTDIVQALRREAERLAELTRDEEQRRLREINLALYALAEESAKALALRRRRHAVLDFDDLIDKTQELLTSSQTPWVHYKLDGSFDHVLIDEAQDTNHAQWTIVEQLTEEIFSTPARDSTRNPARLPQAERKPRSLFVVGDEKQSIYSFQGADIRRFTAARERFRKRSSEANMPFKELTLTGSYRSLAPVLEKVDQTFATPQMLESLQALELAHPALDEERRELRPLHHKAHRKEEGGSASLHLLARDNATDATLSSAEEKSAWANAIATFVADHVLGEQAPPLPLLDTRQTETRQTETRQSETRRPRAGDVLLLLAQRTQLMQPLLAAFAERKLPCEDIDKFRLTATLQAEDILAWLRFLVLPDDELNLASLLKTPFLALSEETLQALCLARLERRQNLWHKLCEDDAHANATDWLKRARAHAVKLSPFEALRFLLERPCPCARSGTAALLAAHRNLDPADNLCEEALAFAQNNTPATLPQFLDHLEGLQVDIKRESITQPTDKMRLMTIHGAKGLEAPIVVLPLFYLRRPRSDTVMPWRDEAHDNPTPIYLPAESLAILEGDESPASRHSLGKRLSRQRKQQTEDLEKEQQRLLYVAMTRARDRLVMLAPEEESTSAHYAQTWSKHLKQTAQKYNWRVPQHAQDFATRAEETKATPSVAPEITPDIAPSFLFTEPAAEQRLQPPRAASRHKTHADEPHEQREEGNRRLDQRKRGLILHSLVAKLAQEEEGTRERQARRLLSQALQPFALEAEERLRLTDDWVAKTLRLLEQPPFFVSGRAPLFEVDLAGTLEQGEFTGRVDLLLEDASTRLFGDLKSDATVPQQLPKSYASQFGVYRALLEALEPKKKVEGYVLWFETGEIQKLSEGDMPQPETIASFSP